MPVYFIQAGVNGPIKIGVTEDVRSRFLSMQTANVEDLAILGVVDGEYREEGEFHRRFRALHLRREWFSPGAELLEFIKQHAREYSIGPIRLASDSKSALGDWLSESRTTQMEFSARSGVPQALLSKYAAGKRRPGPIYAIAIEKATDGEVPVESWPKAKKRAA